MNETKKYYCIKSHSDRLTKGNIYEIGSDGHINYDWGKSLFGHSSCQEFLRAVHSIAACLIPLVEPPAKVGEFVLIVDAAGFSTEKYKNGDICEVSEVTTPEGNVKFKNGKAGAFAREYLVLGGYTNENEGETTMTLEQQREALTAKAAELTKEIAEIDKQIAAMPWVPKPGEKYYFADASCPDLYDCCVWDNDVVDNHRLRAGLIKRTKAEAVEASKAIYYRAWAESLSDDKPERWDSDKVHYYSYWSFQTKSIGISHANACKAAQIYFTTEAALRAAIATIGEDLWIKYVLGVQR